MTGFNSKQRMAADKLQEPITTTFHNPNLPWVMRITADRRIEVNKDVEVTEAARKVLEAMQYLLKPQPVQEPYDQTALELCKVCGWKTLIPGECCLNCERAQPVQEPVAWAVQGRITMLRGEFAEIDAKARAKSIGGTCIAYALYTAPPQRQWIWLSDADIAEVVDTTCQYTGSYEDYLIKKAERKIRSMNT